MHCPRCGKEAREGDQFCRECGAELHGAAVEPKPRRPLRERLRRLGGETRRERILLAGTAIAIVVAIVAFFALDTPADEQEEDRYTATADLICIESKRAIGVAGARGVRAGGEGVEGYAGDLLRTTAGWRSELHELTPPADRRVEAEALDAALLEVLVASADLAGAARGGDEAETARAATQVDEASGRVEGAIDELGLERCSDLQPTSPAAASP